MHRDRKLGTGLLLSNRQDPPADMLRPHSDYIAPALSGVKQERHCQPGSGPYWMASLELSDLILGPRMETSSLGFGRFEISRWIAADQPGHDGELH